MEGRCAGNPSGRNEVLAGLRVVGRFHLVDKDEIWSNTWSISSTLARMLFYNGRFGAEVVWAYQKMNHG